MKLYFAIVDEVGNTHTSVSTGPAIDLLRQVFVSLPTGEFDLSTLKIAERVEEVDHIFSTVFAGLEDPVAILDRLGVLLTAKGHDEEIAEQLAEGLLIFNLVDDGPDLPQFIMDLRNIFAGAAYDLSVMNESQTTLIVRIEM